MIAGVSPCAAKNSSIRASAAALVGILKDTRPR